MLMYIFITHHILLKKEAMPPTTNTIELDSVFIYNELNKGIDASAAAGNAKTDIEVAEWLTAWTESPNDIVKGVIDASEWTAGFEQVPDYVEIVVNDESDTALELAYDDSSVDVSEPLQVPKVDPDPLVARVADVGEIITLTPELTRTQPPRKTSILETARVAASEIKRRIVNELRIPETRRILYSAAAITALVATYSTGFAEEKGGELYDALTANAFGAPTEPSRLNIDVDLGAVGIAHHEHDDDTPTAESIIAENLGMDSEAVDDAVWDHIGDLREQSEISLEDEDPDNDHRLASYYSYTSVRGEIGAPGGPLTILDENGRPVRDPEAVAAYYINLLSSPEVDLQFVS